MSDYHDANTIIRLIGYDKDGLSFSRVERMSHLWLINKIATNNGAD